MIHKEDNIKLKECSPSQKYCRSNDATYLWKDTRPECELKSTKIVEGEIMSTTHDIISHFVANKSLIHIELLEQERICGRKIYSTEFNNIFAMDLSNNKEIEEELNELDVSIFKQFAIANKWIFSRLIRLIAENIKGLSRQHCLDTHFNHMQFSKIHTKLKNTNNQPFAVRPRSNKFILPMAESFYTFSCKKALFSPVKMEEENCYNALPVVQLSKELVPITGEVLFLTPYDRLVIPVANKIPCSEVFTPKYRTVTNNWIAYSQSQGIMKVKKPISQMSWIGNEFKSVDLNSKDINFQEGVYSYKKIEKYEELLIYRGTRESKISKIVENVPRNKLKKGGQPISPTDIFKFYPWQQIKSIVLSNLTKFGNIISIVIGICGVLQLLKAVLSIVCGCHRARKVTKNKKDLFHMILNPLTYTANKLSEYEDRKNSELVLSRLKKLNADEDCNPTSNWRPMYPNLT